MSADIIARERAVLERLKETYEHQGFQFFMEPLPEMLPAFLHGFQPDAMALKPGENYVIEVKFGRRPGEEHRLETVGKRQPGWNLKVYYESQRPEHDLRLSVATRPQIEAQIAEAQQLAADGHRKAALLLGWSVLEAIARARSGYQGSASQRIYSPAQTVQSLEMMGAIDRATGQALRASAQLRNLAAHGALDVAVDDTAVAELLNVARILAVLPEAESAAAGH